VTRLYERHLWRRRGRCADIDLLLVRGCEDRCNTDVVILLVEYLGGWEGWSKFAQGHIVSEYILMLKVIGDAISLRGSSQEKQVIVICVLR
jgi:hypothetical protein